MIKLCLMLFIFFVIYSKNESVMFVFVSFLDLENTLHSGQTFDLSFHGNDVQTTISEFGQCVERLHKL